jgi:hypothetical protein
MTALPGGGIAVVGGASTAFQLFDVESRTFSNPIFLRVARAFHAALALDERRLLLIGGCATVSGQRCDPASALQTSSIVDTVTGDVAEGPALSAVRIGGRAFLEPTGTVLVAGGFDAGGAPRQDADRLDLETMAAELVDAVSGPAMQNVASSVVVGFAEGSASASGALAVVPAGATAARPADGPALEQSVLLGLQSGEVLALSSQQSVALSGMDLAARGLELDGLAGLEGLAAAPLEDGSILVAGADGETHVFRPSLLGPWSANLSLSFADPALSRSLVARDPTRLTVSSEGGPHLGVDAVDEEWLVAAGPVYRSANVEVAFAAQAEQVFLLLAWRDAGEHHRIELREGAEVRLVHVQGSRRDVVSGCSGEVLAEGAIAPRGSGQATHEWSMELGGETLRAVLDGVEVLSCTLEQSVSAGRLGIGVAGGDLRLDLLAATRGD